MNLFLLKKRLWQRCFLVNFGKFSRTPFLQKNSGASGYFTDYLNFYAKLEFKRTKLHIENNYYSFAVSKTKKVLYVAKYSRIDQAKFVEDSL